LYTPGLAANPVSVSRNNDDAAGCGVNPGPDDHAAANELFANPIRRSLAVVVVMFGLTTLSDCVPLSVPIGDTASIGVDRFDPFTTITATTKGCAIDIFTVTVCPAPTVGIRAYHTCVRRSSPTVVLVGPAIDIHALL
jgi:hypothetical protein